MSPEFVDQTISFLQELSDEPKNASEDLSLTLSAKGFEHVRIGQLSLPEIIDRWLKIQTK
jgi:hypothetical protein